MLLISLYLDTSPEGKQEIEKETKDYKRMEILVTLGNKRIRDEKSNVEFCYYLELIRLYLDIT